MHIEDKKDEVKNIKNFKVIEISMIFVSEVFLNQLQKQF